jgi:hypothetical protein
MDYVITFILLNFVILINRKEECELNGHLQGVTITLREIYDSVKELNTSIERIEGKLLNLEEKSILASEAKIISEKALEVANEAKRIAQENQEAFDGFRSEKEEKKQWYWRTIFAATLPYLITVAIAILFLLEKG